MASNFLPELMHTFISLLLLLLYFTVFLALASPVHQQIETQKIIQRRFYITELVSGPNASVVPIAGISGKEWSPTSWGTALAGDNPLTEKPFPYSEEIGRVLGLVLVSSKDGRYDFIASTFLFYKGEFSGSTLQVHGVWDRPSMEATELSVVGGTGNLGGAWGSLWLKAYGNSRIQADFKLYKSTY